MLQVKIKQIVYTKYEVDDSYIESLFKSRQDLVNYTEAVNLSDEFNTMIESNSFEDAFELYTKAFKKVKDLNNQVLFLIHFFSKSLFLLLVLFGFHLNDSFPFYS